MRRALKAKLEYAKFLQKTLDEMAPTSHDDRSSQNARDFVNFYNAVKDKGMQVTNEDIVKFSKLFEDEITLDNMERNQLVALCRLLELTPIGTSNFLRFQLEMKLRQLKSDDRVIQREGLQNLDVQELQNACKERGMRAYGHTADDLRRQLQQWLDLSLNANIPPSLLLLSRTLFLPEHIPATAQIAATISALPQSTATQTSAQIGEREGKVRNVVQLEVIKEEQRKIEAEAAEEAAKKARGVEEQKKKVKEQEKKVLEAAETAAAAIAASAKEAAAAMAVDPKAKPQPPQEAPTVETLIREITSPLTPLLQAEKAAAGKDGEELVDKAPVLSEISSEDLSDLKTAIESLGKSSDEAVEIDNLKKELQEYEEDVEELKTVKEQLERIDLKESKAAQRLFSKVNKMLNKVGGLVDHLEKKEKQITEVEMLEDRAKAEKKLVTVYELIDAVQKLQKTSDASRLEHIAAVTCADCLAVALDLTKFKYFCAGSQSH
jgi:LETM1 and EF-hand domain-containing protein 1